MSVNNTVLQEMKSKPMLCIVMIPLLQNCEKALDRQYKKSLGESDELKVIDAEDELKWKVPVDADQTRRAIEVLNRWSDGKYDHFQFGGGTRSDAKGDAIGICYSIPDGLIVFHIPYYSMHDRHPDSEDVRFSVHSSVEENIQDPFSPHRISNSIKQDADLRTAFVKFINSMKNGNDDERSCWMIINDSTGRRDW